MALSVTLRHAYPGYLPMMLERVSPPPTAPTLFLLAVTVTGGAGQLLEETGPLIGQPKTRMATRSHTLPACTGPPACACGGRGF